MPSFAADTLRQFTEQCFRNVGYTPAHAELIARLMVEANLKGHDTHGVRQIPRYLQLTRDGIVNAAAEVTVVRESPVTAVLDAHDTLGFVGAAQAAAVAIEKCKAMKLAAVGVRNLNHVGRVGAYPEMLAREGLVGLAYTNAQQRGILVAPFGSATRRIGTNPLAAAFPVPDADPVLLDFATSAVAANKIRQADSRGQALGPDWIRMPDGSESTDPRAFIDGPAAMQPLGADRGHKGYALGVMVDIFGGILAGAGTALTSATDLNNGTFLIAIDPEAFLDRADYDRQVRELVDYLRATPPAPGVERVEVPGDYESRHQAQRLREGITVEEGVWADIVQAAKAVEVEAPVPVPAA